MENIYHRVSIRKYQKKQVEKEKIEAILRAAMQAPSACNQQPWEFYVITDPETLLALSQVHKYSGMVKDAPAAIVSAYRINSYGKPVAGNRCTRAWWRLVGRRPHRRTHVQSRTDHWNT